MGEDTLNLLKPNNMKILNSKNAPEAIGPYSQAVRTGNLVFVSGQLPINPATGEIAAGIKEQTQQAFDNINNILKEENLGLENIVKVNVLLGDMSLYGDVNEVYAKNFNEPYPARAAYAVKELPMATKGALIEIEVIAEIK